jgi:hypothetical protein
MPATVFTTAGSQKYHFNQQCSAFHSAQLLSGWDCGCDIYCTHRLPRMHALKRMSSTKAAMDGKLPCLACVPEHLRELPQTGTFGHVGLTSPFDGERYCVRCSYKVDFQIGDPSVNEGWETRLVSVPWPCTSAIVLGLAPRTTGHERHSA